MPSAKLMKNNLTLIALASFFLFCDFHVSFGQEDKLDSTFNPGTGLDSTVRTLSLATNGDIVIGGSFVTVNGQSRNFVARLNSGGGLDDSFLPLQGPNSIVLASEIEPGVGVYIGGGFNSYNAVTRNYFARLRNDASLDLSWPNLFLNGSVTGIRRQEDGKLLLKGSFSQINGSKRVNLARIDASGNLDPTFTPGNGITNGSINAYAIQSDGLVLIAGYFPSNNPVGRQYIARVSAGGIVDTSFDAGYIGGGGFDTIAVQSDQKLIVTGAFTSINGYSRIGIARLNTNGTVDTSFYLAPGLQGMVDTVSILSDGKILIGGNFQINVGGVFHSLLVRLNADGSYDASFNPAPSGEVFVASLQPDRKILLAGDFGNVAGTNINKIARLIGNGTNSPAIQLLNMNLYPGMFLSGTISNRYRIEFTTNLNSGFLWTPLIETSLQTNPQFIVDPQPSARIQRFYRAVGL
jgi:uncharacterized delta-60 repeat protein